MTSLTPLIPTKKHPERAALRSVQTIFAELGATSRQPVLMEWSSSFRLLHGELETQRQADLHHSTTEYGIVAATKTDFLRLVMALETYYCVLLSGLAHRVVIGAADLDLAKLVDGSLLRSRKIFNYSAPAWCSWVLDSPSATLAIKEVLKEVERIDLSGYDKDLVKHLFHGIFSKDLRHSLGEIYTPDWLAELTCTDAIESGSKVSGATFLDPTCGSGTFLVEVIRRLLPSRGIRVTEQVFGFDINPVSALAAKTNLLMMVGKDLPHNREFWIPVFEADCLRTAFQAGSSELFSTKRRLSDEVFAHGEQILRSDPTYAEIVSSCSALLSSTQMSSRDVEALLAELVATQLRNVDYVVGNPPWVNWEYLPHEYKMETAHIWQHYRLFDLRGRDATFIKEDIAALITYVAADRFLAVGGVLAFVIKQSLFKSSKQAAGFRRFRLAPQDIPLKVLKVEDLTAIRAFAGVGARAAILLLRKGESTEYPITYNEWKPAGRATFKEDEQLDEVRKHVHIEPMHAYPADAADNYSGWTSSTSEKRADIERALGTSFYRARTGLFTGGLNAAFWLRPIGSSGALVRVQNISERAKNKLPEREVELEKRVLFPFVTGADLSFWSFTYSRFILCPHTAETRMEPLGAETLQREYPAAWKYLSELREPLTERKGFAGWEKQIHDRYFYALQRIGDYTFARYKVAWRFICSKFQPAVIGPVDDKLLGHAVPIPNEKVIFVGCDDKVEAYYLCGLLSSTIYRNAVESFMVSTQIGPHVLEKLNVPRYDPNNRVHQLIARACEQGHQDPEQVPQLIAEIDSVLLASNEERGFTPSH